MMIKHSIAVLTYTVHHRKTYDTLMLLKARGYSSVTVFAQPMTYVKKRQPLISHRPELIFSIPETRQLCENLGYIYIEGGFKDTVTKSYNDHIFLLCGAGLLDSAFVSSHRIINAHPGYIPLARGLDAYKWSVYNHLPIGVTTHFLGAYVDAGEVIERREIEVKQFDTFHSVAQKIYENEIDMLVGAIEKVDDEHNDIEPDTDSVVFKRMPEELERELFGKFEEHKKRMKLSQRRTTMSTIEFRDLKRQYEHIHSAIDNMILSVVEGAYFISGPEVKELESTLANYTGRKHCISCANGTDAITIGLRAAGVTGGDAVFVPDFTFFSSGECPAVLGATPIFVDVSVSTYNMSPDSLTSAIEKVRMEGKLRPAAVVAVDLFGQPFDYRSIRQICDQYNLLLLEDAAQGFGGSYTLHADEYEKAGETFKAGKLGTISATSFFPAKPLGCYGDGGAIFTDDDNLAAIARSIAVHGKDMGNPDDPNAKYNNARLGYNSRLDTLQAGVLLAKFPTFRDEELDNVNRVAKRYTELLSDVQGLKLPLVADGYYSSWAQYTIQLPIGFRSDDEMVAYRAEVQRKLKEHGIPTNIYYIKPMHKQGAFANTRSSIADCPNTERLCNSVLCLPIHPYLEESEVEYIAKKLKDVLMHLN